MKSVWNAYQEWSGYIPNYHVHNSESIHTGQKEMQ